MPISMSRANYETLLTAALAGNAAAANEVSTVVDRENSIRRYVLHVRWINVGGQGPSRVELGRGWPPESTYVIRAESPISRLQVDEVLAQNATNPISVMVTRDPNGVVGWTEVDVYVF
jgi:hypothetical protein